MPIYDIACLSCKQEREVWRRMNDPNPDCDCGGKTETVIRAAPMVDDAWLGSTKNPGYHCVVADEWVSTKKRRREIIAERGLIEKG